jgi:trehalose synthase-fused probable maltokinase
VTVHPDRERERITTWLVNELAAAAGWLGRQRWFGGKSQTVSEIRVEEVLWLSEASAPTAVVLLGVQYAGGASDPRHRQERYAIVVGIYDEPAGCPVIGRLPWQSRLSVVDAASDGRAVRTLLSSLLRGTPVRGVSGGELRFGDVTTRATRLLTNATAAGSTVRPVGADQSNTSVRVQDAFIFKLLRRLEEGEHPGLEMGRFLTRMAFRAAPPLEGSLVYRSADGGRFALGVLEGWLENQGDGWSYVVSALQRSAQAHGEPADLPLDLHTLGETTAELHSAVASDASLEAFAPEPVTAADVHRWHERVLLQAERTLALVDSLHRGWAEPASTSARALLGSPRTGFARLQAYDDRCQDRFHRIRIHGDFHLGQTLKTPEGFALIDFEGEPTKPLSERREKHCALRDVAGLLRSIDYAHATARATSPPLAEGLSARLRHAYIEGYRSRAAALGATFLPAARDSVDAWIALFELEKALYEVEYEANNRPDWVHIPLRAAVRLLRDA